MADRTILAYQVSNWDQCHVCDGTVTGYTIDIEDGRAYQRVDCDECEASWLEVYTASARIEV